VIVRDFEEASASALDDFYNYFGLFSPSEFNPKKIISAQESGNLFPSTPGDYIQSSVTNETNESSGPKDPTTNATNESKEDPRGDVGPGNEGGEGGKSGRAKEEGEEGGGTTWCTPQIILHPLSSSTGVSSLFDSVRPRFVVLYDVDLKVVRQIELYKSRHPGNIFSPNFFFSCRDFFFPGLISFF
jgi:hypothetical protein